MRYHSYSLWAFVDMAGVTFLVFEGSVPMLTLMGHKPLYKINVKWSLP